MKTIPLSLIAAVLSAAASAAAGEPDNGPAAQAHPKLATAVAEYRVVPREYRLDGIVEAVNRTTVSAQTHGQVEEILYDVNDFVEKGAVIARLKDTEHRAQVAQAAADMKSANAKLQQAQEELTRIKGLYKSKNVSDSAMDKATAEFASAQAGLDAATARLEQAQEQLEYTQIRAPYSGIVTHRHVELGEIASTGQPIMSGVSLEELRVIVDVPQSVIPAVRQGAKARVYLPDDKVIETSRITIFPFADMGSNTFKVRVDLPEETRTLFPGMYVKTGFVTGERKELAVPKAAVVQRSEVTAVYTVTDGDHVHFRQIRLGPALNGEVVVLSGLTEGERVALDPIAAGVVLKAQAPVRHVEGVEDDNG